MAHKEGNQLYYRANASCPIFNELVAIVKKTFGLVDQIKSAILPLSTQIDYAFVYGSIAKGADTANSDIDLLAVSESLAYADDVYPGANCKQVAGKNAFVTRIMEQPKLWIKGNPDVISEAG